MGQPQIVQGAPRLATQGDFLESDHTPATLEMRAGSFLPVHGHLRLPSTWSHWSDGAARRHPSNLSKWLSAEPAKMAGLWGTKGHVLHRAVRAGEAHRAPSTLDDAPAHFVHFKGRL